MIPYGTGRWLDRGQYQKIRNKAKSMGATSESICLSVLDHLVEFDYTQVSFAFKPFKACVNIINPTQDFMAGHFSTRGQADKIKADMDKALDFIEYLKEFDK